MEEKNIKNEDNKHITGKEALFIYSTILFTIAMIILGVMQEKGININAIKILAILEVFKSNILPFINTILLIVIIAKLNNKNNKV